LTLLGAADYEVAHAAAYPAAMAALLAFAPSTQYLFGTDFPAEPMESTLDELPANKLSPEVLQALYQGKCGAAFPGFQIVRSAVNPPL